MAGLDPAIHDFSRAKQDVDARLKAGHDKKDRRPGAIPAFCYSSSFRFARDDGYYWRSSAVSPRSSPCA
jgi:hypothetical protein